MEFVMIFFFLNKFAEEPAFADNGVVERPILPRIPMSQTQSTTNIGDILDDDCDDELLLAIDSVQLPLPQQQQNQVEQTQHQENRDENDSFGDLDASAISRIDELMTRPIALEPAVTTSAKEAATVRSNTRNLNRLSPTPVEMPQRNVSLCDETYSFKIRGINFVFIKQLDACHVAEKLRRRFFIIKAKIIHVTENAQISRKRWSLGVILVDDLENADDELQVRFHNDVLEKLTGFTAAEIQKMNAARTKRPQLDEQLKEVSKESFHFSLQRMSSTS